MFTALVVIASIYTATTFLTGALTGSALATLAARRIFGAMRAQLADAARQLAHDPLTGIHNRHSLRTALADFAAAHPAQPFVAALIDLDGFKEINDNHGHIVGDEVLIEIAERLAPIAAFYGGAIACHCSDEYAALFPVRQHGMARIAALRSAVAAPIEVQADNGRVFVALSASIGMAVVDSTDLFEEAALHNADIAMYHPKRGGGNQHTLCTPGMTMPPSEARRGPRLRDLHHRQDEVSA
ncbi:GGDEF domain-containing protein [Catellatospora sp. NPDC049111]|uniref:GGDEF domain-containing protein n=1 Tax=Catellatospora sp. NPDC049111 TaxID=3155271 RepID=UPI0033D6E1A0